MKLKYNSGLNCPTPAIPIPAFAVPNAAPLNKDESFMVLIYRDENIMAEAAPASPKKGAYAGQVPLICFFLNFRLFSLFSLVHSDS